MKPEDGEQELADTIAFLKAEIGKGSRIGELFTEATLEPKQVSASIPAPSIARRLGPS